MNRQIIFRAWDIKKKRMYEDVIVGSGHIAPQCITGPTIDPLYFLRLENINLMQYVGMKDKNNSLIYEGDVVKRDDSRYAHIIIFDHGCFKEKGTDISFSTSWEIVGNIYQNKNIDYED